MYLPQMKHVTYRELNHNRYTLHLMMLAEDRPPTRILFDQRMWYLDHTHQRYFYPENIKHNVPAGASQQCIYEPPFFSGLVRCFAYYYPGETPVETIHTSDGVPYTLVVTTHLTGR